MNINKQVETRLIQLAKQKDKKAFADLIKIYGQKIRMQISNEMKNAPSHENLEDVYQDTLTRIFKYIDTFKGDASFLTWATRIAKNCCYRFFEKEKKFANELSADMTPSTNESLDIATSDHIFNTPERIMESKQDLQQIIKKISELPTIYRDAIWLYAYREMSYKNIASLLGISVSTAKVRILRARKMLQGLDPALEQRAWQGITIKNLAVKPTYKQENGFNPTYYKESEAKN